MVVTEGSWSVKQQTISFETYIVAYMRKVKWKQGQSDEKTLQSLRKSNDIYFIGLSGVAAHCSIPSLVALGLIPCQCIVDCWLQYRVGW
jgi:hypothetical protein